MIPAIRSSKKGKTIEAGKDQWLPGGGGRRDELAEHGGLVGQ